MFAEVDFYDVVLWIHITAVVSAFGALFAYPVFLALNAKVPLSQRATFHGFQITFSKRFTNPVIGLVLLAGIYLASDAHVWSKAWVVVPLVLLFVIAGLEATVLRHGQLRLIEASASGTEDDYEAAFAPVKSWTYLMIALVIIAVFFMAAKPFG